MPHSRNVVASFIMSALLAQHVRAQDARPFAPAALDGLCKEALQSWRVPGLAIGIVHDDQLIYLRGFGVRKLGDAAPVTPDTVFPLASCTKPFTSLAVGMLADQGVLDWDDAVCKHVPFFRLADPLADANVTLRDLLCHRTGVGTHDLLWYHAPWDLEERIRKIGLVQPTYSFRSKFHYQSTLFGAAGYAAGKAARSTWQDLVREHILKPLEMKSTFRTWAEVPKGADHAGPHRKNAKGEVEVTARYPLDSPDPAGSLHSTARDLLRFVRFQMGDGTWQGKRLLSAAALDETHTPHILVRRDGFARIMNPDTLFLGYGLGWIVQDHRGQLLLMHGGAIDGFRAHFTLVPKARLGIVLLNNLDSTFMNLAVSHTLLDRFFGLPFKDWNRYYQDIQQADEDEEKARAKRLRANRQQGTKPSKALRDFSGAYDDAAYGAGRVVLDKDRLLWSWGNLRCPLEHFHYDTFLGNNGILIDAPFVFHLGADGQVATLEAMGRTFKRIPDDK